MQNAFALGNRQFIIRPGEMVHTDKLIAALHQRSDGLLQNIQFLLRGRQISLFDFALGGKQRRQMRVVEYAQAIRVKFRHTLQRISEAFGRLFRQAVYQVDIGGSKADFARMV